MLKIARSKDRFSTIAPPGKMKKKVKNLYRPKPHEIKRFARLLRANTPSEKIHKQYLSDVKAFTKKTVIAEFTAEPPDRLDVYVPSPSIHPNFFQKDSSLSVLAEHTGWTGAFRAGMLWLLTA